MPTYVYECKTCSKTIEVEQRITEDPLKDCDCGANGSLRRLIQPTAVLFKGAGFHINDYSGKPTANASEKAPDKAPSEASSPAPAAPCGPSCACSPGPATTSE
ncbi:MAG: hypothetical protein KIT11_00175 [Fimbriimonadaceae bacterium]|nr:hypothetical protein [Fimbriimonadaceae bacterium]QYK55210.1 MAG: hypothetical protein KF733_09360 [Fimbriimonadaceae bacterium]